MSLEKAKLNPLVAAASVAVILFSGVGIGVMTGLIPSSKSANDAMSRTGQPAAPVTAPDTTRAPASAPAPAAHRSSASTASRAPRTNVAANDAQPARSAQRSCYECGSVDSITVHEKKGESTWMGPAGGAVVGGLIGNQIGNGRGNTAATVVGAVGGAVAGNEVEKRYKSTKEYKVSVRMEDGSFQSFNYDSAPPYAVGDRVRVVDGHLTRG